MVDFNEKMNDILSDYYSTIGKFRNISDLISLINYKIDDTDDEEIRKVKEGQQREILVDLGRVAEMAFKYLIKIRRMELYPNEPYLDTVINGNSVKGFKEKETLTAGVVRDLGNKVHALQEDVESILNVSGVGPKAHNFNYLYLIIDKLMPDVKNKLNEVISMKFKSDNILNVLNEVGESNYEFVVFPNESFKSVDEKKKEQSQIIDLINNRIQTISDSGDIFTRLRYYANNPFDKNFSIDEVYSMVSDIVLFIKLVHSYNDNLHFNPEIAFSFNILKDNPSFSRFSFEEIKNIYSHSKIRNNTIYIMSAIFYSENLLFDEIIEILNCDEFNDVDYSNVFLYSLNLDTIRYFRSIGISDYEDMSRELIRKTPDNNKKLINVVCDRKYTLEEYEQLRNRFDAKRYPRILSLLEHISEKSVFELMKYPDLLSFFINDFYINVNKSSYQYNDRLFKGLLDIQEVRDNPNSWYGLDIDQLEVYYGISQVLLNNPLNDSIINKRNYYMDTITQNIKDNIDYFKYNPKMLCVMPLMLDFDDNKYILDLLIRNGLNLDNLRGFDSTIFCLPTKLVDVIEHIFISSGIPLIVGNKVNPSVISIISSINRNMHGNINIKNRRILFRKNYLGDNLTDNPVVDELSYDMDHDKKSNLDELDLKLIHFDEVIRNMNSQQFTSYIMRATRSMNNNLLKK